MSREEVLPEGVYWLGDPCYVIPSEDWNAYLEAYWKSRVVLDDIFQFKGKACIAFSTAYGDGEYKDQDGNTYCVDSGLIGLTPVTLCGPPIDHLAKSVQLLAFVGDLVCYSEKGLLTFGRYEIDTDNYKTWWEDEEDY